MSQFVLLDTGLIGLLTCEPNNPETAETLIWARDISKSHDVIISDIVDFEIRRELLRIEARKKLLRLANLNDWLLRAEVTRSAWVKAAEFWSEVRQQGKPTAHPEALDGDTILAGVAATLGTPGDRVVIATTNVRHLQRFPGIVARPWREV